MRRLNPQLRSIQVNCAVSLMSDIKRCLSYRTVHNCSSTAIVNRSHFHSCGPVVMRPSSLGGGRILHRTLSVSLSVRPSRYRCHWLRLFGPASVTSRHLANYNDTHVLFATRRGPHIVRPSRPHKFLFLLLSPS